MSDEYVYPEDFGAVADGTTNCCNALQATLNTGGKVKLSPGTYLVDGSLILSEEHSGGALIGCGRKQTELRFVDNSVPHCIGAVGATKAAVNLHDFRFDGLRIRGPGIDAGAVRGIAIHNTLGEPSAQLVSPYNIDVVDVQFTYLSSDAFFSPMLWGAMLDRVATYDIGGNGLVLGRSPSYTIKRTNYLHGCAGVGLWLLGGDPVVEAVNIGHCAVGLKCGRKQGDLPAPYDAASYCRPRINGLNVEPATEACLRFEGASYPVELAGATVYSGGSDTVGVSFRWLNADTDSLIRRVRFSNKPGCSFAERLYVQGAQDGTKIVYTGPDEDISQNGATPTVVKQITLS